MSTFRQLFKREKASPVLPKVSSRLLPRRYSTPWARPNPTTEFLTNSLAAALGKRGHEVYAPLPKYQFPLHTWEESIIFIRSLKELEEKFDIVQGHNSLRNAKGTTEIANRMKAQPFQWVVGNIFLSWNDFFYMVRHELPILVARRKRFLGHLVGLAPRSINRGGNKL